MSRMNIQAKLFPLKQIVMRKFILVVNFIEQYRRGCPPVQIELADDGVPRRHSSDSQTSDFLTITCFTASPNATPPLLSMYHHPLKKPNKKLYS